MAGPFKNHYSVTGLDACWPSAQWGWQVLHSLIINVPVCTQGSNPLQATRFWYSSVTGGHWNNATETRIFSMLAGTHDYYLFIYCMVELSVLFQLSDINEIEVHDCFAHMLRHQTSVVIIYVYFALTPTYSTWVCDSRVRSPCSMKRYTLISLVYSFGDLRFGYIYQLFINSLHD